MARVGGRLCCISCGFIFFWIILILIYDSIIYYVTQHLGYMIYSKRSSIKIKAITDLTDSLQHTNGQI